jgi:hypothetical protein
MGAALGAQTTLMLPATICSHHARSNAISPWGGYWRLGPRSRRHDVQRLADETEGIDLPAGNVISSASNSAPNRPCAPDLHQLCQPLSLKPVPAPACASAPSRQCADSALSGQPRIQTTPSRITVAGRRAPRPLGVGTLRRQSLGDPAQRSAADGPDLGRSPEGGRSHRASPRRLRGQRSAWVTAARAWDAEWTVCSSPKPSEMGGLAEPQPGSVMLCKRGDGSACSACQFFGKS